MVQTLRQRAVAITKTVLRSRTTLVFLFFLVVTLAVTYPYVTSPRTILTAPLASDTMSSVIQYGAMVREGMNPFVNPHFTTIAQPDGVSNNVGVNRVSFLSVTFLLVNSYLFGPIAAHSLQAITGFLLTAFVMFLFVRAITKSTGAGIVAGLIYGFWPQMLSLGRAAPTYTHMWMLILPMWAFWNVITKGVTKQRVVLAAASVLPAVFWTPYFAFHVFLVGMGSLLIAALYLRKTLDTKKLAMFVGIILGSWIVTYGCFYALGMSTSSSDVVTRSISDAYQQSASPLMYLLPGEYSVWGSGLNEFLVQKVPRALHTGLYLGITVMLLAALALLSSHKKFDKLSLKPSKELKPALYIGLVVAFICFIFSLPPTLVLFGHEFPMPNHFVVSHVSALRAGQRLVMPLMGAVVVMAGIGTYLIARKYPGRAKYVAFAVIAGVVCFDLWSPYPDSSTKVEVSSSITQLKDAPAGRVAQYKASSLVGYPAQISCLMEVYHQKPVINDCGLGRSDADPALPSPHLAKIVTQPLCKQPASLQKLDVRYVIVEASDKQVLKCFNDKPFLQDNAYKIFKLQ